MSLLKWLSETFTSTMHTSAPQDQQTINPASGLPMIGSVDIAGNVYGMQLHDHAQSSSSAAHDWHPVLPSHTHDPFGTSSASSGMPSHDFSRPPIGSSGDW